MADPFDSLRTPVTPTDPDPEFRARLRARIERAMRLPKGVTVSNLTLANPTADRAPAAPGATVTPYLAVAGAEAALDWYRDALGARVVGDPIVMGDGRIGHAELELAGGRLFLAEEHPEIGHVAPEAGAGSPVSIHLDVPDVDGLVLRAAAAGATIERPPADHPYGRNAALRDPFGHRWLVSSTPAAAPVRPGDVGYASLWVRDIDRATRFFAAVLGWRYEPASGPGGRRVAGLSLHHGLWERDGAPTLFLSYAVDDIDAAVARVRQAGGTATDPRRESYGVGADCTDDQGIEFALHQAGPASGDAAVPVASGDAAGPVASGDAAGPVASGDAAGPVASGDAGAPNGRRPGDLAYITMEVVDSARARAFYGSVLGWTFTPGRVADGWGVEGPVPMTGLSGGHDQATIVPMYRVDDIDEAVRAVRAAGGTASDPEVAPYGRTSTCDDGQGARFYLGQL